MSNEFTTKLIYDKKKELFSINLGTIGKYMLLDNFFEWYDNVKKNGSEIIGLDRPKIHDVYMAPNQEKGLELFIDVSFRNKYHHSYYDGNVIRMAIDSKSYTGMVLYYNPY